MPAINCKGHLGFEIYENNIVVGFSHKNYYEDYQKYPENYQPIYKIVAYDRLLDHSKPSSNKKAPNIADIYLAKIRKFLRFK